MKYEMAVVGGGPGGLAAAMFAGVRGLSEETLKTARPKPQALEAMKGYAASKEGASGFAKAGKLKSQHMDYLPPPGKGGN